MSQMIPVNRPLLDGNERKYLNECIDSGWVSSDGPFVSEFELRFAAQVNRKHAIAVSNGTSALDAAIEALGLASGDEVIMPTFTIISCINQIIRNGCIPVLIDSEMRTWNMKVEDIEARITSRTKAILVSHIYGLPVDLDPVLSLAERYGLRLIEDAAEMHGQNYKDRPCGSFGDISTFSFYANKHITTGEGGMILTDSDELAERCRSLRNLGFSPSRRFLHERLGWNLRMTNMQAALGLAQLERLDLFIRRKKRMGRMYSELLHDVPGVLLPVEKTSFAENIYWVYGVVIEAEQKLMAQEAMDLLARAGVATRPFFVPMHLQPILTSRGFFSCESHPVSEWISKKGFYLPSGTAIRDEEIEKVAEAVLSVLRPRLLS